MYVAKDMKAQTVKMVGYVTVDKCQNTFSDHLDLLLVISSELDLFIIVKFLNTSRLDITDFIFKSIVL